MTPNELLELATSRFVPLYYNDPEKLNALLYAALGTYQDRAGCISSIRTAESSVTIPPTLLEVVSVQDAYGRYHEVSVGDTILTIETDAESVGPFTIWYLVDLRKWDADLDLPGGVAGAVIDYLVALIDIYNTERARAVAQATGRQIDLPSNEELMNRKLSLEADMADAQGFLPMISVY